MSPSHPAFSIEPFDIDRFLAVLSAKSLATPDFVASKLHATYFKNYFSTVKPACVLYENDYVDHDFIEDHSGFYNRCFISYERKCTRIHFFKRSFSELDFLALLSGTKRALTIRQLQKAYLGFVVLKPLPKKIIGRTCLKTYPSSNGRRNYPITRTYRVGLFGLPLEVESLAFQEQDGGAAACATSALWSVFQGTGLLFGHATPSPVEITKMAASLHTEYVPRALPNAGLTSSQMIHAMLQLGLEPLRFNAENPLILKIAAYSYLRARIPLLLTVGLQDISKDLRLRRHSYYKDRHAVAVTGYRLERQQASPIGKFGFKIKAARISKLYVHDDQVGPFAKMVFDGKKVDVNEGVGNGAPRILNSMRTSWLGGDGKIGHTRAIPEILFVPLYHKIRIDFDYIRTVMVEFDSLIKVQAERRNLKTLFDDLEWDIFLGYVNDIKEELIACPRLSAKRKEEVATKSLPKFLWRCIACKGEKRLVEFLFDATDVKQGRSFICAIVYDDAFFRLMKAIGGQLNAYRRLRLQSSWPIIEWLSSAPAP